MRWGGLPQEEDRIAIGSRSNCSNSYPLQPKRMRKALGLAAMIIVLAVFMPDVLRSLETFLLTLFNTGTSVLQSVPKTAEIYQNLH
jgi:hypothetical protein